MHKVANFGSFTRLVVLLLCCCTIRSVDLERVHLACKKTHRIRLGKLWFVSSMMFLGVLDFTHKECNFATITLSEIWPRYAIYTNSIDEGKWFTCGCHQHVSTPMSATSSCGGEHAKKQTTNSHPLLFPIRRWRHTVNDQTKVESNAVWWELRVRMQVKQTKLEQSCTITTTKTANRPKKVGLQCRANEARWCKQLGSATHKKIVPNTTTDCIVARLEGAKNWDAQLMEEYSKRPAICCALRTCWWVSAATLTMSRCVSTGYFFARFLLLNACRLLFVILLLYCCCFLLGRATHRKDVASNND